MAAQVRPWNLYVHVSRVKGHLGSSGDSIGEGNSGSATSNDEAVSLSFIPPNSYSASSSSSFRGGNDEGTSDGRGLISATLGLNHFQLSRSKAFFLFNAIASELERNDYETASGEFSFLEHGSNYGYFSTMLAQKYPNATVVSLERDPRQVRHHLQMLKEVGVNNNAVCPKRELT